MRYYVKLLLVLFVLPVLLTSCNSGSKEKRFQEYINAWQNSDYGSMYDMLSKEAKSRISREKFVGDHDTRYKAMDAKNLAVNIVERKQDDKNKDILTFNFKMDTAAGTIEFLGEAPMVKEEGDKGKNWYVDWTPSMFHKDMKEGSTIGVEYSEPSRGRILDRNLVELALDKDKNVVKVEVVKSAFNIADIEKLSKEIGMEKEVVEKRINAGKEYIHIKYLTKEEFKAKTDVLKGIKGVNFPAIDMRYYPFGDSTTNLIGYINDYKGETTRLEEQFNERLKGEKGCKITIKDTNKNVIIIANKGVKNGEDIRLAIDSNLQQLLYNELKDDTGSAVAINPKTGEVLALVSTPSVDGNLAARATTAEENAMLKRGDISLLNSSYNDSFAPGSTIKPFTAAIGLDRNIFDPNEKLQILGETWDNNGIWKTYPIRRVEPFNPSVDLRTALTYSDNIYFARRALQIKKDPFSEALKALGIGENVPNLSKVSKSQISNNGLLADDKALADTSYGQGQMLITPVQLAYMYTVFLNDGNMVKPILEKGGNDNLPEIWKEKVIKPETANLIKNMLVDVVEKGTGKDARIAGKKIAGKTGTAQVANEKLDGWFVGFDADENPELLIVMMVNDVNSNLGSHYVVPKVKRVMEQYLK